MSAIQTSAKQPIGGLHPLGTRSIRRATAGAWPSGKASVFGTVYRRFESYRPSQYSFLTSKPYLPAPMVAKCPEKGPVWESRESVCDWSIDIATGLQQIEVHPPGSEPPVVLEVFPQVAKFVVIWVRRRR